MLDGPDRLREWIERSKCNQTEAARILGVHKVVLSDILNRKTRPGLANAIKIEQITGIAVESWLLTPVSERAEPDTEADAKAANSPSGNDHGR